eukprot:3468307-Amphidinium_carterae.1
MCAKLGTLARILLYGKVRQSLIRRSRGEGLWPLAYGSFDVELPVFAKVKFNQDCVDSELIEAVAESDGDNKLS